MRLYLNYRKAKAFTPAEAWLLFKLSAWAESFGWTLLITGILLKRYVLSGNDVPVKIAGQIHGTLFLIYFAAATILAPSLSWSGRRTLVAIFCSVPPYGSLVFELWQAHLLKNQKAKSAYLLSRYWLIVKATPR